MTKNNIMRALVALLLTIVALPSFSQEWKMVVTNKDDVQIKLKVSDIRDITFIQEEGGVVELDQDLRVLVLGNSFAIDATAYLDELVKAAGINADHLGVYVGMINGGQFADWVSRCQQDTIVKLTKMTGNISMTAEGNLKTLLGQYWDMIVLLQASDKSYVWDSFNQSLPELLDIVKANCLNTEVRLAYQLPWGHTEQTALNELEGNIECARKMMEDYGIEHIIPVGVAVQNARNTTLNTPLYLTRDNWHLCMGVGRYVAACTFFESVIAPVAHTSVLGNPATHSLSEYESNSFNGSVAVDDSNKYLCQQCAYEAVRNPFVVTAIQKPLFHVLPLSPHSAAD